MIFLVVAGIAVARHYESPGFLPSRNENRQALGSATGRTADDAKPVLRPSMLPPQREGRGRGAALVVLAGCILLGAGTLGGTIFASRKF